MQGRPLQDVWGCSQCPSFSTEDKWHPPCRSTCPGACFHKYVINSEEEKLSAQSKRRRVKPESDLKAKGLTLKSQFSADKLTAFTDLLPPRHRWRMMVLPGIGSLARTYQGSYTWPLLSLSCGILFHFPAECSLPLTLLRKCSVLFLL